MPQVLAIQVRNVIFVTHFLSVNHWWNTTFHSFIHYGDLYIASSRLLLRSSDPCTAKKKSFEPGVECVRKNPGEQLLCQRKPIPLKGPITENARACVVEVRGYVEGGCLCEVLKAVIQLYTDIHTSYNYIPYAHHKYMHTIAISYLVLRIFIYQFWYQ